MTALERQTIFFPVAAGGQADVRAAEYGCPKPANARGPMVAEGSQHGAIMEAAAQPTAERIPQTETPVAADLGGIRQASNPVVERCGQAPTAGDLGILGEGAVSSAAAVCPETEKAPCLTRMRIVEVARLLNSTPLGEVINERQLYRHRVRSGDCFRSGRRHLNFLAYVAWLVQERHRIKKERSAPLAGPISAWKILSLIKKQEFRCALTGRALTPENVALDHVLPMSRGGLNEIENAQALHKEVNRAKGILTNEEFIQLCREVAAWTASKETEKAK